MRWQAQLTGNAIRAPQLHDGTLLVVTEIDGRHHLTAFDAASGDVRWEADTGVAPLGLAMPSSLLVVDELVLTGDPLARHAPHR